VPLSASVPVETVWQRAAKAAATAAAAGRPVRLVAYCPHRPCLIGSRLNIARSSDERWSSGNLEIHRVLSLFRSLKAAVPVAIKQPIKDLLRDMRRGDVLDALDRAAAQGFPMKIPSVDEWFRLSLKYPEFHRPSHTVLKDYGYMEIMAYLDTHPEVRRVLEFGHGFNSTLFVRYGRDRDICGHR
jgi:hypothetical protein